MNLLNLLEPGLDPNSLEFSLGNALWKVGATFVEHRGERSVYSVKGKLITLPNKLSNSRQLRLWEEFVKRAADGRLDNPPDLVKEVPVLRSRRGKAAGFLPDWERLRLIVEYLGQVKPTGKSVSELRDYFRWKPLSSGSLSRVLKLGISTGVLFCGGLKRGGNRYFLVDEYHSEPEKQPVEADYQQPDRPVEILEKTVLEVNNDDVLEKIREILEAFQHRASHAGSDWSTFQLGKIAGILEIRPGSERGGKE